MKIFITTVAVCLLISCTDNKKKEIEQLSDEVIVLHDEVMPLMDRLYQIRLELQTIASTDSSNVEIASAISHIKTAEDAMMNWMRNFNPTYEGANPDETIQYLQDQKNSIKAVGKQMKGALKSGQQLLEK